MVIELNSAAVSLALAVAGAVTLVAYKHPDGYSRLHWALRALFLAVFVAAAAWDLGSDHAFAAMRRFLDPSKLNQALDAQEAAKGAVIPIAIADIIACFYCEFLAFLPRLLAEKNPDGG